MTSKYQKINKNIRANITHLRENIFIFVKMTLIWTKIKICLHRYFLPEPDDFDNYDQYNTLCATLDKIDPRTVLQSRLMGGQISAMFALDRLNPNTQIFTLIIYDSFPNAHIVECSKDDIACAQFY
jgi:hypothetical protein